MKNRICFIALIFLASAGVARAQTGCSDSPECATPILALVGAAGLLASRWIRNDLFVASPIKNDRKRLMK